MPMLCVVSVLIGMFRWTVNVKSQCHALHCVRSLPADVQQDVLLSGKGLTFQQMHSLLITALYIWPPSVLAGSNLELRMCIDTEDKPGAHIVRLYVAVHDPLRVAEVQRLCTTGHASSGSPRLCHGTKHTIHPSYIQVQNPSAHLQKPMHAHRAPPSLYAMSRFRRAMPATTHRI